MAKMLSIEIGCSNTKAVLMDYKKKKPKVYKCAEFPTPQGAIDDGYIVHDKLDELAASIKKGLKKNRLKAKRVVFTVHSGKIISREIVIPGVKEHQIGSIIKSNMTEYFPIELDEYKIAYIKLTTFKEGENAGKHKVLVIAAEKSIIDSYEELSEELRLKIVDIDYSGNSAFQALKNNSGTDTAVMLAKIEDESTLVTIAKQGAIVLQRNVNYNIGEVVAEDRSGINEAKHTIVGTVQRVVDYYEANNSGGKVSRIYLIGEGSKNGEILKLMQDQTEIDCMPLDIIKGVTLKRKVRKKRQVNVFAAAIGAGMESVGLDNEREKQRHGTNYGAASVLMVILFILLGVSMVYKAITPYNEALEEQAALQRKQQELEPAKIVYDQYTSVVDLSNRVDYGIQLTQNSNDAIVDFLEELERKLPADVEMSDFYSDDTQVVMSLKVADKETAAGVINKIRDFDSLESVVVSSITEETSDEDTDTTTTVASEENEETDEETTEETTEESTVEPHNTVSFTITAQYYVQQNVDPANN
jgi:Tfp pilus assembly PilM family ATPase